jgi:hypothetical protein
VTLVVVAGTHVGVRRREVAVDQHERKGARAIVHIDVAVRAVARERELDRRRATGSAEAGGIALVVDRVVHLPAELA